MIKTKSIQTHAEKKDGVRICIMRRIKPEFEFDIWMPTLAPSTELLQSYHEKIIDWKTYEKRFDKEVLSDSKYLDLLEKLELNQTITLLCWEETPEKCHRRLVAEKLIKLHPQIKIVLK